MLHLPRLYNFTFPAEHSHTALKDLFRIIRPSDKCPIVNIGVSKFGKGLFAEKTISKGSLITNITGSPMRFDEAVLLGEKESYPFQVGLSDYIAPSLDAFWQYINHSCDPNCGVNENLEVITIKKINAGEELLFDYSTTMLEKHWTMPCQCNSKNCRHNISDFDTLLPATQQYYLKLGVVQQFIKTYLNDKHA